MFLSLLSSAFYTRNFCSEQHNRRTESALCNAKMCLFGPGNFIMALAKLSNTESMYQVNKQTSSYEAALKFWKCL